MATGVATVPLPHVRVCDGGGVGFKRTVDFAKVVSAPTTGAVRTSSSRGRALVAKSSSTGSDTVELEPSSEGSPLLGTSLVSSLCRFWLSVPDLIYGCLIIRNLLFPAL